MKLKEQEAFTLIEMIIAITVFTIFIGVVMSSYLAFHRAQQDAAATRSLLLEMESAMNLLTQTIKENTIDYEAYEDMDASSGDILSKTVRDYYFLGLSGSNAKSTNQLILRSADGETQWVFEWDEDEETFSIQAFDEEGEAMDGYTDPILLHTESTQVSFVNFDIFPSVDPYDSVNSTDDDTQYQPVVRVNMSYTTPSRVREDITLDLQTSVTSRFYQ